MNDSREHWLEYDGKTPVNISDEELIELMEIRKQRPPLERIGEPVQPKLRVLNDMTHIIWEEPNIGQTKRHSFYECIMNVIIGYIIAIGSQLVIFPMYGIHIPIQTNLSMGLWFVLISIIRTYVVRRWFNKVTVNR